MREVQFRLKQLGYLSNVIHSTGKLDTNTRRALNNFQKAKKLTRTKAPDPATRAALDTALIALR
jgi:peptidoglycan hydrolase-like protein with peptidoglycan-binding domain